MSILSNVTSILESTKIPGIVLGEDCKQAKPDDCGDGKQSNGNDDHKDRDDHLKQAKNDDDHKDRDDHSKHAKNDDDHKGRDDDHKDRDDHLKQAKNDDDHKDRDDHAKHAKHDDDHKGRDDDHKDHDDHLKHAKNDDCQPHKDDCQPQKDVCQPQKDYCDPKPSDDCGKGDTCHNHGEALAKLDFCNIGSQCPDHAGDIHSALAAMPSVDHAICQMGPADHFDVGHFDAPTDASHEMGHHA